MTVADVLKELKPLAQAGYKKILLVHGVKEPVYGIKIEDMKKLEKRVKNDHRLALELYDSGVFDLKYLAGLVADDAQMTKKDLKRWLDKADCDMLSEYTVPWVAAGSPHGHELALEWIESKKEIEATAGWAALRSLVSIKEDADLDLPELKKLLQRVQKTIHQQPNRVRSMMNSFVIAVGNYVKPLSDLARETAESIGPVTVDMDGKACKIPSAPEAIEKVRSRGPVGKKRKSAKC